MEAQEQIENFKEFIDEVYRAQLSDNIRKGHNYLIINFEDLSKFDLELANLLLDQPEETIKASELAAAEFDNVEKNFKIRIKNLPESSRILIRNIRSKHIGKFVLLEGIVRQKSDVRPQVTSAKFECPACGNVISILQLDGSFKEPSRCSCGRKGKFHLLSKELVDAQGIVLEEVPEQLEGGEQPKRINVFLKDDLVSPFSEKRTSPGSKIRITGVIKEVPIILKTGAKSTRFDLLIEANHVEAVEETFLEMEINEEEERQIKEIAQDPRIYQRLVNSLAPSIFGHDRVKEALALQLLGGSRKVRKDGVVSRGDMHVLLIGDPGCIAGDSQVALIYKGMEKIQALGTRHLEPITEVVTKIRKHGKDRYYDFATVFQHYQEQPVLKVVLETGKSVTCTYNQPFLTKKGWKRADEILMGAKIRVMPKIPSMVKKLAPSGFARVEKKSGCLKPVSLPEKVTPELAALYGYILGDGCIHPNGYRVTCYVNNEEKDLINMLVDFWSKTFCVDAAVLTKEANGKLKMIDDGGGLLRQIMSVQKMHLIEINSRQVAQSLSILSNKRVPQQIFKSPKYVVARFISWLFEADGCAFGNGRGRTSIQLKSKSAGLLQDVQLLLLYFGIQSRIIGDNLCIRRSYDMESFAKYIGFNSEKKRNALEKVLEVITNRSAKQKRKKMQRYERVVKIEPAGTMDVYDFEVPVSHTFIANGIVCHNSGKSAMLKRVNLVAPKGRYVSGKGVSGAGLTASVVRDEFLKGWSLEAGAMVLASNGICMIDEMDKMNTDDRAAMHEALEQQTVSISKANIQATLLARTTVLAAANPKFGRFDPYGIIADQINLPPTLINRFDLIFPIKDLPDPERDEKMAGHILHLHQTPDFEEPEIPTPLLRKYFAYARQKINPILTDSALQEIKQYYVEMRNRSGVEEGASRAVPISPRQLEALVRLSEANARARFSDKVTKKDARRAIDLLHYCLMAIGRDPETGKIDIDRIATGISASARSHILQIKEIISELESKIGKTIPIDDVLAGAREKGIEETQVEEAIEKLKRSGDLFEPRRGFISRI